MLQGVPARPFQRFGTGQFSWPADLDGETLPPAGAPGLFVRHQCCVNTTIDLLAFHVDWDNPQLSSLETIATISHSVVPPTAFSFPQVPQPGTSQTLEGKRDAQASLQYRNHGTHETLISSFTGDVDSTSGNQIGVGWVELRRTNGGNWTLYQEGETDWDGTSRFDSAAAMDGEGNVAVGYSVSNDGTGTPIYPGLRYTGRLVPTRSGHYLSGSTY